MTRTNRTSDRTGQSFRPSLPTRRAPPGWEAILLPDILTAPDDSEGAHNATPLRPDEGDEELTSTER